MKSKKDIIKKYNDNIPILKIAEEYGVTKDTIYKRLKSWGIRRRSGIRHLLYKMVSECDI
ncbi:hypothetical protein KAX08_00385 [candidate division WOR-3 bacterium]|nr:hypothetical protein [candidate division WOR-3 bacterium]